MLAKEKLLLAATSAVRAAGFALPPLCFGALGWLLLNSNVRVGLADFLKSSDVLVLAVLAVLGSMFSSYVAGVRKRLDAAETRVDAAESRLDKLKAYVAKLESRCDRVEAELKKFKAT